jgi:hypothetical protein
MVYAMMEYTVVLIDGESRPRPERAAEGAELKRRLLALNDPRAPHRLVEHGDVGLLVHWDPVDPVWRGSFARVKLSNAYGARMLLDETRCEVRWYEWSRTGPLFIGFEGSRPRVVLRAYYAAGDLRTQTYAGVAYGIGPGRFPMIEDLREFEVDVAGLRARIADVASEGRWTMRSTHIWFQTRPPLFRLTQALVPEAIRMLPRRRFWGIAYPASYALAIAALWAVSGPPTARHALIVTGISVAWWGLWGLLVWPALGAHSRRRPHRRS